MKNVGRILAPVLAAGLLITALGCLEDTESPTAPEAEPGLATAATTPLAFYQVSGGGDHTCGITTDNRAYCWGSNAYGQLGDGTTTDRLTPVAVAGELPFRQVSAGDSHTCAVTTTNRAYCWGYNGSDGELGDGTATDRLTPVPVAGGRQFRQVDAAQYHTCGVSYPDNKAYCWGYNGSFALGDGTSTGRSTPVAVSGGRQFRQVSAGGFHTCGVTTLDKAFCWGWNNRGQLGDGSKVSRPTPSPVAGTRRFRQVDAGYMFTCGVTTDHRAFCWGSGLNGQMGDGNTKVSTSPRAVAGGFSFDRVTAGALHTCGETTNNRAYCWGTAGIGDGTTTRTRLTPVAVAGGRLYSQVSAGDNHTCGKTTANVAYCWGLNGNGELGDGTTTRRLKPVAVVGP